MTTSAELEECLGEMSLTDDEREEVQCSLANLMEHGSRLSEENETLRTRLKDYENRSFPVSWNCWRRRVERAQQLDGQVQALTAVLIDGDELVERLRSHPRFLTDDQWTYL